MNHSEIDLVVRRATKAINDFSRVVANTKLVSLEEHMKALERIEELEKYIADSDKSVVPRKYSSCCNAVLIPFISGGGNQIKGSYKECSVCHTHYAWELDEGQKPLFKRDQD